MILPGSGTAVSGHGSGGRPEMGEPRHAVLLQFHLGEVLVKGVSLAVGSRFVSSEFTISHLAMHPTPGQEKCKLHISCCLLGNIHQWPQPTPNSASYSAPSSPRKAGGGLQRDLEEPSQLNGFGCSHRLCLLLQNLKSSINYTVKSPGFIINTQQI